MIIKKYWSLLKTATSAAAVCSITAVAALATSCVANKDNSGDSQLSNITIKDESPTDQNISVDNDTTLNLYVDATSTDGDLTYQWYVDKNDSVGWVAIIGATSNSYEVPKDELNTIETETTWKYRVEIASVKDPNNRIISNEYIVNIKPKKEHSIPLAPLEPSKPSKPSTPSNPSTPSTPPNYDTEEVPSALQFDYDKVNISDLSSAPDLDFYYKDEITKRYDRKTSVGYYTTELESQYGDKGFKYPSYNYNYESGKNKYLYVNGTQVNMMNLVYNERINFNGKQVTYSDANWIKDQITKNELKAHPAAKTWYQQNVSPETQAVDKHFTIGPTKTGLYTLGLYAPAGEVITLKFDDETFKLIQDRKYTGLKVIINDNYWNNYKEGNTGQISNRYPFLSTTFSMDSTNNTIKFGSPFGGNISINISSFLQDASDSLNSSVEPISFTVSGAVESLNYVHGYTTESDWNRQMEDVENGIITAPNMSAMYSWSSMNIPFTGPKIVGGQNIAKINYPYETFKKWNNFQFLSVYTARSYSKMLSMKFCDDIWGGAAAWGGGHNLYAPITMARTSFLSGVENFNIKSSWGMMHEMNHTYQQDNTMFKKMYHNKTNQMSMVSFSLLSDMGRYRNENNILQEGTNLAKPGWTYLSNSFGNIEKMNKTKGGPEYVTYGALLFTIGARNYIEYTRWAAVNHRNNVSGWTGLKEIQALSNYFKVDLWPAFQSTYRIWHDGWPASYDVASNSEKEIIDSLKQYSATEFVGNLYAAGSYLYDGTTKQYRYTGDVNAPYEISGYQDYVFDFENYINSSNLKFNWSKITVDAYSKNGVPLSVDGKKVNYLASKAGYSDNIDEFDVTITPGDWEGKPTNYVPGYKWKIKVRNAIQEPKINLYTGVTSWNINSYNHAEEVKKYLATKSFSTRDFSNQAAYELKGKTQNLLRASFSFIAPSTGYYSFNSSWSDSIVVYANNNKVKASGSSSTSLTKVYEKHMTANEVISFDIFVYKNNSSCSFNFGVGFGDETVNLANNLLGIGAYKAWQFLGSSYTFDMYRTDQRFQYKPRFEDYLSYTQNTNGTTLISNSSFVVPNKDLYTLKAVTPTSNVYIDRLYNMTNPCVEIWTSAPTKFSFDVDFKNPTQVGSLRFGHRTDNHQNYRPTKIKVTGIDANNKSIELYDGDYSSAISSRSANSTIVNLNSEAIVKTLKIELVNTISNGLVLNWFSYSPEIYMPLNNNIAVDNNYIAKTKDWSYIKNSGNDYQVASAYGSSSLLTTTKYAAIDFNLKNSSGFKLIGATTSSQSVFDVYINDKIYKRNVKVGGGKNESNVELFRYALTKETDDLRVTIVNKSNSPLIINFIQTFGYNGPVYTSPVITKR